MTKRSSIGSRVLCKLADITSSNPKSIKSQSDDDKSLDFFQPNNDVVDDLLKENVNLMKIIAERNKIIDQSAAELQKLRASLRKLQSQNSQLAQTNSRISAEHNLGKEKIKSLEHEILCKENLLKASRLDVKGKEEINNVNTVLQEGQKGKTKTNNVNTALQKLETIAEQPSDVEENDENACNINRNLTTTTGSQSSGLSTSDTTMVDKERNEDGRHCLSRESDRINLQVGDNEENLVEIKDVKSPLPMNLASQCNSAVAEFMRRKQENSMESLQRPSVEEKPVRRAPKKFNPNYKETRVTVKTRRE